MSTGSTDIGSVPVDENYPLSGVHANVIHNIVNESFISEVTGLKMRSSGKAVKRRNASNIDQLQICFNTTENQVTEPKLEEFVVRIINPLGETLAVDELGSGIFTSNATGEQIRYTKIKEYDYNRDANTLCLTWQPNIEFLEGNYDVEIYNKGYLAGTGSFTLK